MLCKTISLSLVLTDPTMPSVDRKCGAPKTTTLGHFESTSFPVVIEYPLKIINII